MMSNWFPGFSHQWRLFGSKSVRLFIWQLLHRYSNTNTRFFKTKRLPNINVYSIIIRITTTCFVFYFRVFGTGRSFWELEALKEECTREGRGGGGCVGVFDTLSTANQYRDTYLGSFPQDFAFLHISFADCGLKLRSRLFKPCCLSWSKPF